MTNFPIKDLLTSEQCSIIIKSLTKLPEQFNVVVYPCLVTITFQNEAARNVISKDFNLEVCIKNIIKKYIKI